MTELRLHQDLYASTAVDEAVKTFDRFASLAVSQEGGYWVVKIGGKSSARERQIHNELANFALGLTVKELKTP